MADNIKKIDDNEEDDQQQVSPSSDLISKLNGMSGVQQPSSNAIATLLGQNQQSLQDAQDKQKQLQLISMLGHAAATTGAAFTPMANVKPDESFYNNLNQLSQQPVQQVLDKQASQQKTLQSAALQQSVKNEMDKADSNSDISKTYREIARQMSERAGMQLTIPDNATAANLEKAIPGIESAARFKQQQDLLNQNRQAIREQKTNDKQAKALSDASKSVYSFRGNAGAQQASKDVLNVDKALNLIDQPGPKTTQDLRLLADEMGKVASGGVPSEHGTNALMPSNLKTKYAEMINFLSSKPTDAQATEYLAKNKQYLQEIGKTAKNTLLNYQMNIAKGYKKQLHPDDYNDLVGSIKAQYGVDESNRQPSSEQKFDKDVLDYAKSHNISPEQAQQIKISRTQGVK